MRATGGRHRPERAGVQRSVPGELAVAQERGDLAHPAILVGGLGPVGVRRGVDAVDGDQRVVGIGVATLLVAVPVAVGEIEQSVTPALLKFAQSVGEVLPQLRRVHGHDGSGDRIAVAQTARVLGLGRCRHQRIHQIVIDGDGLGRVGAQRAVLVFGAISRVVVECLLERRRLVDIGLDRVGVGIDRAVEDHRAHLVRIRLGVGRSDQRAVGVAQVGEHVVAECRAQAVQIPGHVDGADVGEEVGADLVDTARDELLLGRLDALDTLGAVVDLRIGAKRVIVGIGIARDRR